MLRRALLWLAGLALVVGALLLTDRLLWEPGLTEDICAARHLQENMQREVNNHG